MFADAETGFAKTIFFKGGLAGSADWLRADAVDQGTDSAELPHVRSFASGLVGDAKCFGVFPLFGEGNVKADTCEIGTRLAGLHFGSLMACRRNLNTPELVPIFPGSKVVDGSEGE